MDLAKENNNKIAGTAFQIETPQASIKNDAQESSVKGSIGIQLSYGLSLGPEGVYGEVQGRVVVPIPEVQLLLKPVNKQCRGSDSMKSVNAEMKFSVKPVCSFVLNPPPKTNELTLWSTDFKAPFLEKSIPAFCIPLYFRDGANKDEKSSEIGESQSTSGTGDTVANADVDPNNVPPETSPQTYSLSDDVLGLHSDQNVNNGFAENQGVQLADILDTAEGSSTTVAGAPQTYQLSNDYLNFNGDGQINNQFPAAAQGVQIADGLLDTQNPSSENNVASSSGSSYELGSLPSSASNVGVGSDPNYQAFASDHGTTNQYTATLQGGGDNNAVATSGDSNTGSSPLFAFSGNDNNLFGAYNPSTPLPGTTTPANGIDEALQPSINNNQLFSSGLGADPNLFQPSTVVKRKLVARAI
ncbi:hypothetical protein MMC07_004433 [Pseudocyphellaria aurata]|nr:hypothetical protein [Pseudocyphellaria aurata]